MAPHLVEVRKPRALSEPEWEQVLLAVNASWLRYVMEMPTLLLLAVALLFGTFAGMLFHLEWDLREAFLGMIQYSSYLLVPLLGFRVLFRSIDRAGKRKLARDLGLIR